MEKDYSKSHYVDNKKLLEVYKPWRLAVLQARAEGKEDPEMPAYYAESMIAIASHLSWRPNFIGYSWRDEFISDAIENMITYKINFDPDKSDNIFSYLTTISYYAFVRRITKEKKQGYIKSKLIQQLPIEDLIEMADTDDPASQGLIDFLRINNGVDTDAHDERLRAKRQTRRAVSEVEDQVWEDPELDDVSDGATLGDFVEIDERDA